MKGILNAVPYGLWVLGLAGCAASHVVPASNGSLIGAAAPAGARYAAACRDRRTNHARCMALILDGTPKRDGASGPGGGWAPADLEAAYNLPSSSKGSAQVVAIVDAYDNPNAASDLAFYRSYFGLPTATFYKYNQEGQQGNYPQGNAGWGVEIDLDVEMVSASCPNCTIDLVEADSNASRNLNAAEAEAVKLGAHIVSNSWDGGSCAGKCSPFHKNGVVYLVSAGDGGFGTEFPMDLGSVVSVGGTHLVKGGGKRGWSETVWGGAGFGPWGTGSGCSDQPKPSWQHDSGCAFRTANDVSAVADPYTGVSEYDTYSAYDGWVVIGGTSVATPLVAGIFGLAGNAPSQDGGETFWEPKHERPSDLNRVLRGSNGNCTPTYLCVDGTREYKNYGGPTGWGTPNGIGAF